ncbi:M23 family metallopeptidase [Ectobacillus panaciterrae]|uniref:M23 family metallopeptidase n=1 Tax=Ectobacillus panaciterrae TaxID=363872 RepID=UPI000421FF22|nr:M23 family metallopeptidase [Ectobacillus panaciterrae]
MPHVYQRTPFNPQRGQVRIKQDCHNWGARDLAPDGIEWGEPVYAVEDGTVVSVNRNFNCFSQINTPNSSTINPDPNCWAHMIVVKSDSDEGYFTEYAHVMPLPAINVGTKVKMNDQIGNVDNSGPTSGPHVHFARWKPNPSYIPDPTRANPVPGVDAGYRGSDLNQNGTCDWTMKGVNDTTPSPPTCSNGWSLNNNGEWMFCQNGVPQRGWFPGAGGNSFFTDSNGVWAGFIRTPSGNIQYRPRQFRNLPASDPNVNTVVRGDWVCSLDQWWFFDNNGNMVSNTTVGRNQNGQWVPGLPGRQIASDGHCTDCAPSPCSPQT